VVPGRRELAGGALILALLVALAHGPALGGGFVYDDHWTIVDNAFVREPGNLTRLLSPGPAQAAVPDAGRPALLATEIADHALWGLSPRGWHLQNLVWHLAVALLFFAGAATLTGSLAVSLLAAGLFAVHPLNVEAVAAINYREDLLAAFFTLAALVVIGAHRSAPGRGRGRGRARAAAFALAAAGGFAKESAVMAPILLVVVDLWTPPDERRARRIDQLVLAGAALVPVLWRAWVMGGLALVSHTAEIPVENASLSRAVPQAAWSFLCGLGQLLVPWRFSADYAGLPGGTAGLVLGWSTAGLLLATGVLAWRSGARHRWMALGYLGALAAYLPTFGVVAISNLRADRYFYLASLPLCLLLAVALVAAAERAAWLRGRPVLGLPRPWLVAAVLLAALGARARVQARVWRDDLTLWTHATRVEPGASRAWTALAEARLRRGSLPGARAAVETSLALADDPHARELFGIVLMEAGELERAHLELERALAAAEPHHRPEWLNNLGLCELRLGRLDEALARFDEVRRLAPGYQPARLNAARALELRDRPSPRPAR
jgi:hypothetical protein